MAIQSPTSPVTFRPQNVRFGGGSPADTPLSEGVDVFERRGNQPEAQPGTQAREQTKEAKAFEWIKGVIEEGRKDPKAPLSTLLSRSEIKRKSDALLQDMRQTPPFASLLPLTAQNPEALEQAYLSGLTGQDNPALQKQMNINTLLGQADDSLAHLDSFLDALQQGKPALPPIVPDWHPLKPVFNKQNEELKARQQQEREEVARSAGIEDTPELRKELLEQGVVASEAEIPAFLKKFGLGPAA